MSFGGTIKTLRNNAGLSQQAVAEKLGMARATYASLEINRREPDLAELRGISRFYEIPMTDLVDPAHGTATVNEPTPEYKSHATPEAPARDPEPQINPDKLREVLLYVLSKVGGKPNVGETVLYKLLYFIDFDYYERYGQSVTGLTYVRNHYGPTPTLAFVDVVKRMEINDELEIITTKHFSNTLKKYLPVVPVDLQNLSAKELAHIDQELARLGDKSSSELAELSRFDTPWIVAKQGDPILYRDVFYRTVRTSVTEPLDEL